MRTTDSSACKMTTGDPERDRQLKEWLELADYLDDQGRDPICDVEYRPPFGERYLREDVSCHLHFVYLHPGGGRETCNFCAEHYPLSRLDGMRRLLERQRHVGHSLSAERVGRKHYWYQQSVLVRVGQIAEKGERVEQRSPYRETFCDGMIWLKPLNDCHVIRMNLRKPPFGLTEKIIVTVHDGKLHSIFVSDVPLSVQHGQLEGQVIESAPEVVQEIPEDQRGAHEVPTRIGCMAHVQDVLAGMRVVLNPESWEIWWDRKRLAGVLFQGVDVFLTSLNLGPTTV